MTHRIVPRPHVARPNMARPNVAHLKSFRPPISKGARRPTLPMAGLLVVPLVLAGCWPQDNRVPPPAKVPVRSEVLVAGPFQASLTLLGKVEPATRLELRSAAAGTIHYPARFRDGLRTGEQVKRGELLFEVENDASRLRLAESELAARLAESELDRARRGVEGGFLAAAEFKQREIDAELASERLTSARRQFSRLRFQAPASGVLLVDRVLAPGSEITASETLVAELAGEGLPRVEGWAAAAERHRLRAGLEVECILPGSDKVVGRGSISEIAGQVDRAGTLRVVVAVSENTGLPLPGEGLELRLLLDPKNEALTVPRKALIVDGGITSVFVLEPTGSSYRSRRRLVQSGAWSQGRVEIYDGLSVGERVAVEGAEFLADGLPATEANVPATEADVPATEANVPATEANTPATAANETAPEPAVTADESAEPDEFTAADVPAVQDEVD